MNTNSKVNTSTTTNSLLRQLPSVDKILQALTDLRQTCGHQQVLEAVQLELMRLRDLINSGAFNDEAPSLGITDIVKQVTLALQEKNQASLRAVINLSGTILHTNLGRAILPEPALQAVVRVASAASNLEYDLSNGQRGERDSHVEKLICELTGAEAATVVNNNAAAVLLVLNTLALGREVPVSRGELVEIGGSFRIPEVMERSGCILQEVGTTNRTHLKDYAKAINKNTALLLKVHTSNYRIEGFTNQVPESELADLAHAHNLPFVIDMGSGSLIDFKSLGLPAEPTAAEALTKGADIITFSGDKLLGGPQCGIIAGRKALIEQIQSNPLKRALRLDKMTLAALSEVLKLYRNPATLLQTLPTLRYLTRTLEDIRTQAKSLVEPLQNTLPSNYQVSTKDCFSQIGSGALPIETILSVALVISSVQERDADIRRLTNIFRQLPKPIIGRIHDGMLFLDIRCLDREEDVLLQLDSLQALLRDTAQ